MNYQEFIQSKQKFNKYKGLSISNDLLNPKLKDFQKYAVSSALNKGRFALFEDCGLGKTAQQLEWSYRCALETNKPSLILAPLAVTGQTINEGKKFGIEVNYTDSNSPVHIINYEQLQNINASNYGAVALDESSILKNFTGKYRNLIIDTFLKTKYKLACTATPSPNDPEELGNHAEFLGIMSRTEMLATYFIHDGGNTSKWRLKKHAQDKFWEFICSFSLVISKPSDVGFSDEGYVLPKLNFVERQITTEAKEGLLFNTGNISSTDFHNEVRLTSSKRLKEVIDIVNNSNESFIIWVEQNAEGDYLGKMIPDSIQVSGSSADEYKKDKLLGFANNEFRVLITKPKIASFGMNYQNCHNQIFASPDHSFEKIYQAIRRSLRFGQMNDVNVWLITTDTMENVLHSFNRKQSQHEQMIKNCINAQNKIYGRNYIAA